MLFRSDLSEWPQYQVMHVCDSGDSSKHILYKPYTCHTALWAANKASAQLLWRKKIGIVLINYDPLHPKSLCAHISKMGCGPVLNDHP